MSAATGHVLATRYALVSFIVAAACFSIGTWYYLRRVEP